MKSTVFVLLAGLATSINTIEGRAHHAGHVKRGCHAVNGTVRCPRPRPVDGAGVDLSVSVKSGPNYTPVGEGLKMLQNYEGSAFFDGFEFFTASDPTHGQVDYVADTSLAYVNSAGNVILQTYNSSDVDWNRKSIRMTSKEPFQKGQLLVIDFNHMPTGCGNWPAFWTVGANWPTQGEIDIIEGVNNQVNNQYTLHTTAGCTSTPIGEMTGKQLLTNCDATVNGNTGCGTLDSNATTFGAPINKLGGAVVATQFDDSGITIHFFPRGSVPKDLLAGAPRPSTWGIPTASFSSSTCASSYFGDQTIVINNTLGGDWAAAVFGQDPVCAAKGSASEYIRTGNFDEAYWDLNYIRTYALE